MDMVFILLIFFIVTTTFTRETGVQVNKPKASTAQVLDKDNILIAVTREGAIYIHEKQVDLSMLRGLLKRLIAQRPERSVVIIADRSSETGIAVDIMDECNLAGVKKVSIAAMKE
jgi:biopolymer transport protein ExbD